MSGNVLIVDGYNVIRTDPSLRASEARGLEYAREELLRRLEFAPLYQNDYITVVFDGRLSGQQQRFSEHRGKRIKIIYSRHGERADDVIIQMIVNAGDPSEVAVMSNDRAIGMAAKLAGCQVLSRPDPETQIEKPGPTIGPAQAPAGVEYDDMFRKRVDYEPEPVIIKKGASWHPKKKERQAARNTWSL